MNKKILSNIILYVLLFVVCSVRCTKKVTYIYCDNFTNKDSLIRCVLEDYNLEAYDALACCYNDSNIDLYGILIADSSGVCSYYAPILSTSGDSKYGLSDTAALFYETKAIVMGCYTAFNYKNEHLKMFIPDSIYDILCTAYHRYGISVWDKDKYRKEYDNLDSLHNIVIRDADIESYQIFRLLASQDSLLPVSKEIADKTHLPLACYDVYYNTIRGYRMDDEVFQSAYNYLCEAADSMYYPAVFIKAGLCLTGAYFPQDTIMGKDLLEQCYCLAIVPFWQQYSAPAPYLHLMKNP